MCPMDKACLASTEDVVQALLEFLVVPLLPHLPKLTHSPPLSLQQCIAKQVHAVVLLYNYYHRKSQPHLEFLAFDSFCKLIVVLRPTLIAYMSLMCRSDYSQLDDLENYLSLTEKAIMDACDISASLDASRSIPCIEGWPITKVAVLLIESQTQKCLLLHGTVTQGVWSLIEKNLDACAGVIGKIEGKCQKRRVGMLNRFQVDDPYPEASGFQELALLAVEEVAGIKQNDIVILESSVVHSLSKEMTAARFYIMQCSQSNSEDFHVYLEDLVESLKGPLIEKTSSDWMATSALKYFHLLPYAATIRDWITRDQMIATEQKIDTAGSPMDDNVDGDHTRVLSQSSPQHLEKLSNAVAAKDSVMSKTTLKYLLSRRDYLSRQKCKLDAEIALCDKSIDLILEETGQFMS